MLNVFQVPLDDMSCEFEGDEKSRLLRDSPDLPGSVLPGESRGLVAAIKPALAFYGVKYRKHRVFFLFFFSSSKFGDMLIS